MFVKVTVIANKIKNDNSNPMFIVFLSLICVKPFFIIAENYLIRYFMQLKLTTIAGSPKIMKIRFEGFQ